MGKAERRGLVPLHAKLIGTALLIAALTACSSHSPKTGNSRSKEYFPESKYGVKASPRVSNAKANLPRGGGRYHVGKPYKIKGNWFHPKEQPNYSAEGSASWYGDAFHGRLTANGEVYDMTHLTAAHPTLPLPSYARVTNLKNNSSVIVRINDRGPFERSRLIDLSKRAAEMLDYKQSGTAKVRVEYVGPAPLHGQDDSFLMASYKPSGAAPDPSDGLPTGVMIAMNGPTPTQASTSQVSVSNVNTIPAAIAAAYAVPSARPQDPSGISSNYITLPSFAPIPTSRPGDMEFAALSYAEQRINAASRIFDPVLNPTPTVSPTLDEERLTSWWNGQHPSRQGGSFVNLGLWASLDEARGIAKSLEAYGSVRFEETGDGQVALALTTATEDSLNDALRAAWDAGAIDAFIVRN